MAILQLLSEEQIPDDRADEYFEGMYRVVCVGERPGLQTQTGNTVRSTYIVDWEQLVHLLEDYTLFGEDIVEVTAVRGDEARRLRMALGAGFRVARA